MSSKSSRRSERASEQRIRSQLGFREISRPRDISTLGEIQPRCVNEKRNAWDVERSSNDRF
jgi:hypothetical protein